MKNVAVGDGGRNLKFGNFDHIEHRAWSRGASPIHVAHVVNAPQSPEDNPVAKCLEASAQQSLKQQKTQICIRHEIKDQGAGS